jgi:primosomal replication protein N
LNNLLVLDGEILSLEPTRFSPAGVPITKAILKHESRQSGQLMQCELTIAAQGEMARQLSGLNPGSRITVSGAITRTGQNSRSVMMWIEQLATEN